MMQEMKIHREKPSAGGERRWRWMWPEMEKGEKLYIQKYETVFVLMKIHLVYEKERDFHNSALLRNFPEINLSSFWQNFRSH